MIHRHILHSEFSTLQMFQNARNMLSDMLHTLNTHNQSKTCITWTQNVFRYHEVKTNGAKGRLGEKIAAVIFVLTLSLADLTSSVDWLSKTNITNYLFVCNGIGTKPIL